MHKERFGVIILAAGASTRMGSPKQLLKVDGVPLLRRAAYMALAANFEPVIIVLGANAELLRSSLNGMKVDVAWNAAWQTGMTSTIRCGMNRLIATAPDCEGALLMVADQPNITSDSLNKILKARGQHGAGVVAARYKGGLGTPAYFAREYFARLLKLEGASGAKKLLEGLGDRVLPLDLPEAAEDLDTPEDFATFISNASRRPKQSDASRLYDGRQIAKHGRLREAC